MTLAEINRRNVIDAANIINERAARQAWKDGQVTRAQYNVLRDLYRVHLRETGDAIRQMNQPN